MKKILLIIMLLFPTIALASSGSEFISLGAAIGMEAFVSIHMSAFVLYPLANMFSKEESTKKVFITLFCIRLAILLFFDFFVTTAIAMVDFFAVFIGAFIVIPICGVITKKKPYGKAKTHTPSIATVIPPTKQNKSGIIIKCTKCNSSLTITDTVCPNCGTPFDGNNIKVEETNDLNAEGIQKIGVLPPIQYDKMFDLDEDELVEEFINRELLKAGIDKNTNLIPRDILKRKKILNIIFAVLLFVFISMIFFHFPIYTYIIGIIVLFIFYKVTKKYDLMKYLEKEIKSRPGEKVSNIVMNAKSNFVTDNTKIINNISVCLAIILPLLIFINPKILYEKIDGGYAVRYYTFGLSNFTSVTIPETHKNEKIISLRGNTFSNMPFLKEVILPDSIIEIRGQAFKNDKSLIKVNIPSNLEYLGGGAFYNCTSITSIELPDTLTYLGGEAFYNAKSLKSIKLSENLTEIKGNTFENCTSLESITIPDSITRIGGHAFYGNKSLSKVTFTQNSKLSEIGSSAFRRCDSLYRITIPKRTNVNSRAFKESPTSVQRFNDISYGDVISSLDYEHERYVDIYLNQKIKVNEYMTYAKLQDAYLTLNEIKKYNNKNEFILTYNDNETTSTFTLSSDKPHMYINDNLAIEIASKYVFDYEDKIYINVYYN